MQVYFTINCKNSQEQIIVSLFIAAHFGFFAKQKGSGICAFGSFFNKKREKPRIKRDYPEDSEEVTDEIEYEKLRKYQLYHRFEE